MPDVSLNGIEFKIKGSSEQASDSIKSLTKQLNGLTKAISNANSVKQTSNSIKEVGKAAKSANKPLANFVSSLKRIAFYRVIRSIIKSITSAFQEGLKNAYQFSKMNDGVLAASLDLLATKSLTMKNQLGAAFGALITTLAPIIESLVSMITTLANALTMLFAAIGGNTQYKHATDVWTEWGEAAAGAGGAAKEALKYLAPFDELNRLPDQNNGGGGGGANTPDYSQMFEYQDLPEWLQNLAEKINEFQSSLKITFDDVFFEWKDLTGEQIAEKVIVGVGALLGAGVGFVIGGVPGAVVGTILGATIGLSFSAMTFDHDGVISKAELADMVSIGLAGLAGGVIGFVAGGPGGALIGASIAVGITALLKAFEFGEGESSVDLTSQFATAMTVFAGAVIGFTVGGPGGALIGAAIGLGISATIESLVFSKKEGEIGGNGRTGLDYFIVDVLGLPSDDEWRAWGQSVSLWFGEGLQEFVDEVSILLTGNDVDSLGTLINNKILLLEGRFKDIPAHLKQIGIDAINNLIKPFVDGLNQFIEDHPNIAAAMGLDEPIEFQLIPNIPESELNKHYNAAKEQIEAQSKQAPTVLSAKAQWDNWKAQQTQLASASANNPVSINSKANITAQTYADLPWSKRNINENANITAQTYADLKWKDRNINENANITAQTYADLPWAKRTINENANITAQTYANLPWKNRSITEKADITAQTYVNLPWANRTITEKADITAQVDNRSSKSLNSNANFTSTSIDYTPSLNADAIMQSPKWKDNVTPTMDVNANIHATGGWLVASAKGGAYYGGMMHSIPQFASGGRAHGSLIWAGESGAEVVGHIGGRTEVLNRSQMASVMYSAVVAGISRVLGGVSVSAPTAYAQDGSSAADENMIYRAFKRALEDADFAIDNNIEIDGYQIYDSIVRTNRREKARTGINPMMVGA